MEFAMVRSSAVIPALIASVLIICCAGGVEDPGPGPAASSATIEASRKAAEGGDAKAQTRLGVAYETGKGAEFNWVQAVSWYRKAADQGDHEAEYRLGACYGYGRGVAQDHIVAVALYRKAAAAGQRDAQMELGSCYQYGFGVGKDQQLALKCYGKA